MNMLPVQSCFLNSCITLFNTKRHHSKTKRQFLMVWLLVTFTITTIAQQVSLGIFDGYAEMPLSSQPNPVVYDSNAQVYQFNASCSYLPDNKRHSHFIWKRMTGNFILYTRTKFNGTTIPPKLRAGWMIRSNLEEGSPFINAGVDTKGLVSLQVRRSTKDSTEMIPSKLSNADVIQLERRDTVFIMSVARYGEPFVKKQVTDIDMDDEVYVGLFISSENKQKQENGIFRDTRITIPVDEDLRVITTEMCTNLEVLDIETGNREIIYTDSNSMRAPIWKKDNKAIIYSKLGLLYAYDLNKRKEEVINTGNVKDISTDHVLSFDGSKLSFSSFEKELGGAVIYNVPVTGGTPRQVVPKSLSYPHGWSPDGKTLAYCAARNGKYDVYTMAIPGGKEVKLTNARGINDGPEYTPDGKYIYFNSNRTGTMLIWRMKPDGSKQEPVTTQGEFQDWFPHISPNGKWIVFLSYSKEDVSSAGHPSYKQVYLRLLPISGGKPKIIAYLYGGQASFNSPCWSPDSKKIAFVSFTELNQ